MSLLGSIFGDESSFAGKKKDIESGNLSGMFEKSAELPEKPHHVPVERPAKRKEVEVETEETETETRKRKKKRKSKNKETEETENPTTEGDIEDEKAEGGDQQDASEKEEGPEDEKERTIFVGNLPLASTTRKSLAAIFKDCGPVSSTRIRSVPVKGIKLPPNRAGDQNLMKKVCFNTREVDETMKDTVQGYVVFKDVGSVQLALKKNNKRVGGYRIRVDKASPTVDPSRSVFCGNLPYGAEESSLQEHFIQGCDLKVEDVLGVRIIRDKETFQCKGFGYVLFREKTMVPLALKLHESTYMRKQIRVLVCGKRFKGKKGEQQKRNQDQSKEKVTVGAFRRIIAKQAKESAEIHKRKRGEKKKKIAVTKKASGLSRRAALDKKVDKRVKKLQKRISKGMGKTRR